MRRLQVCPKAQLSGPTWHYLCKVDDLDTGVQSRFVHDVPAGVTAETDVGLLLVVWEMTVPDGTPDSAIDDALFTLDIRNGPQVETVWGNWQALAETILAGLPAGYDWFDFWAAWTPSDTASVRQDARKALVQSQTGWQIDVGSVHQHEGDGTTLVE